MNLNLLPAGSMTGKAFLEGSHGHAALARGGDAGTRTAERWAKGWGVAAAIAVHLAAAVFIFRMSPAPRLELPAKPIMVSMIEAPKPPEPVVEPPKPRPVVKQPQQKQPVRAPDPVPVVQPTPVEPLIASAAGPSAAVREVPAPAPAPAPVAEAPAPKPPPAPVVEPRFDAAYLNNPAPAYPPVSRRLGEQGRVLLRVQVDEQGTPTAVTLRTSSGHDRLDNVALETVRRWKFVPAKRGEEAVSAWVIVPIVFNLRS